MPIYFLVEYDIHAIWEKQGVYMFYIFTCLVPQLFVFKTLMFTESYTSRPSFHIEMTEKM